MKRFWAGEPDQIGHIVRKRGGSWAFHYDIDGDPQARSGYRFGAHAFVPGEYVSIKEHDGACVQGDVRARARLSLAAAAGRVQDGD